MAPYFWCKMPFELWSEFLYLAGKIKYYFAISISRNLVSFWKVLTFKTSILADMVAVESLMLAVLSSKVIISF